MFDVGQRVIFTMAGLGVIGGTVMPRHGGVVGTAPKDGSEDDKWKVKPFPKPQRDKSGHYMVKVNRDEVTERGTPLVVFAHASELAAISPAENQW